jgi:nicotinate-nucleotide pyrophosphorylase (carboxylating)
VPENAQGKARLLVKDKGIVAGVELAELIFKTVDQSLKVEVLIKDGEPIEYGHIVLYVEGNDRSILTAERLVLNCMQRMSGIATVTNEIVKKLEGTKCKVLDTRKTTPGFRLLEKWAVKIGGGVNHRFGLFDMILIKDNHVDYAGGIKNALFAAQKYLKEKNLNLPIVFVVEDNHVSTNTPTIETWGGIKREIPDNVIWYEYEKEWPHYGTGKWVVF